jgi:hypothetical protein
MAITPKRSNPFLLRILFCGYILVPLVLWVLPANFFDDNGVVVCVSKWLLNMECYACGLTRAVQHALHGEFSVAFAYNKLVVVVLPLLIAVWVRDVRKLYRRMRLNKVDDKSNINSTAVQEFHQP